MQLLLFCCNVMKVEVYCSNLSLSVIKVTTDWMFLYPPTYRCYC